MAVVEDCLEAATKDSALKMFSIKMSHSEVRSPFLTPQWSEVPLNPFNPSMYSRS